uniref:protein-serine/threonine phosphatase n=1 Tax=Oryza barthii TaxID=65489 RepID=A0A0D3EQG8_9ORYZ
MAQRRGRRGWGDTSAGPLLTPVDSPGKRRVISTRRIREEGAEQTTSAHLASLLRVRKLILVVDSSSPRSGTGTSRRRSPSCSIDPDGVYFGERIISRDESPQPDKKSLDVVFGSATERAAVVILDDTRKARPPPLPPLPRRSLLYQISSFSLGIDFEGDGDGDESHLTEGGSGEGGATA